MKLNTLHSKTIIMDSTTIFYYAVLQCMRGLFRAILKVYLHIARQGRMHCIKCIVLNACIKSHVCIQAVAWYVTCKRSSMPLPFDIKIPMEPNWKIDRKFFLTLLWERNAKMWHTASAVEAKGESAVGWKRGRGNSGWNLKRGERRVCLQDMMAGRGPVHFKSKVCK